MVELARISVGAWRNFCSQAHRNATARFGGVARFGFFMKLSGGNETGVKDLFTKEAPKVNMYTNDSPDELKPKLNAKK